MKNKKANTFAVIGLGRFGSALAKTLAKAGKDVIAIDSDENKVRALQHDTEYALVVDEITKDAIKDAGILNCDTAIVCIGEHIEGSILATLNLVSLGVKRVIAKATSPEHGQILEKLGAEVVYPEHDMAIRLAKRLLSDFILDSIALDDNVEVAEIKISSKLENRTVFNSEIRKKYGLNIIVIVHEGKVITDIAPEYKFAIGDKIMVIGNKYDVKRLEDYISG
ncbi:MAG: TrkA family potassium uptake protein [Clostridiales bacterium]|nr:TrkA family potassium uptake protein [Clostridiales bacterium]